MAFFGDLLSSLTGGDVLRGAAALGGAFLGANANESAADAQIAAAREGQAQGVTMRAEADAHETGRVIAAISSGLSDNVYHLVRDYLNTVIMGLDPYNPFDMTTRSLARQIEGLVTASTRIEFIVAATMREGGLAREPGATADCGPRRNAATGTSATAMPKNSVFRPRIIATAGLKTGVDPKSPTPRT